MNSTCDADHLDLVQTTPLGNRIRRAMEGLDQYVPAEGTAAAKGWSMGEGSLKGSNAIRMAFWAEFDESTELNRMAKAIIPEPKEEFTISRTTQLLTIQSGELNFVNEDLVEMKDCIVLIPHAVSGSAKVTVKEPQGSHGKQRTTTIMFKVDSIYMISGRCSISVPDDTKLVCVMLCMWRKPV